MEYYINTINNMQIHINDQEKENAYLKHLNNEQMSNNFKIDMQLQNEEKKTNKLQEDYDTELNNAQELAIQLESVMNENLELTAKVSNLLTIEENSMAVNNTYEEQLENMFHDKAEVEKKLNNLRYTTQITLNEKISIYQIEKQKDADNIKTLTDDNNRLQIEFKNISEMNNKLNLTISKDADNSSDMYNTIAYLEEDLLKLKETLFVQVESSQQLLENKSQMQQNILKLESDLSVNKNLNCSLQEINAQQLQNQFNSEQDILKLQHQLVHEKESHSESENILNNSEYRHKILEKQCEIDRLNILIQRKENLATLDNKNEKFDYFDGLQELLVLIDYSTTDMQDLDAPVTESYNRTYDINKLSREIIEETEIINKVIVKQNSFLSEINSK